MKRAGTNADANADANTDANADAGIHTWSNMNAHNNTSARCTLMV